MHFLVHFLSLRSSFLLFLLDSIVFEVELVSVVFFSECKNKKFIIKQKNFTFISYLKREQKQLQIEENRLLIIHQENKKNSM